MDHCYDDIIGINPMKHRASFPLRPTSLSSLPTTHLKESTQWKGRRKSHQKSSRRARRHYPEIPGFAESTRRIKSRRRRRVGTYCVELSKTQLQAKTPFTSKRLKSQIPFPPPKLHHQGRPVPPGQKLQNTGKELIRKFVL